MVLDSLAASILTRILGSYVSGLDNISLTLTSGHAVLENLELKPDALRHFQLPFNVKKGLIGKLTLHVPWTNLKSKPCTISIERLFLIARLKSPDEPYDAAAADDALHAAKMKTVEAADALRASLRSAAEKGPATSAPSATDDGFGARLLTKILDNLQLEIRDVSLRFEDGSDPEHPLACGITLDRVQAYSTNANWDRVWVEGETLIHKLVTLNNFAIYADPNASLLSFDSNAELSRLLLDQVARASYRPQHEYILEPVLEATLHLTFNKSNLPDIQIPKADLKFRFSQLAVGLSSKQVERLMDLFKTITLFKSAEKFRGFRPNVSVKQDPGAWWRFAGRSVMSELGDRHRVWSSAFITQRIRHRKAYVPLYRKVLAKASLSAQEAAELEGLERLIRASDLILFRSAAEALHRKHEKEQRENRETAKAKAGWFSWFSSSGESAGATADIKLTDDDWRELMELAQPDVSASSTSTSPEHTRLRVELQLSSGALTLSEYVSASEGETLLPIVKSELAGLGITCAFRPNATDVDVRLRTLVAHDVHTRGSRFSQLLGPEQPEGDDILRVVVKVHPSGAAFSGIDHYISADLRPMRLVLNPSVTQKLRQFLRSSDRLAIRQLQMAANHELQAIKDKARQSLELMLNEKPSISINLNLRAPTIVIPEAYEADETSALLLSLGTISFMSRLQPSSSSTAPVDTRADRLLEHFDVALTDFDASLVVDSGPGHLLKDVQKLVPSFDFNLTLTRCKLPGPEQAEYTLKGRLPLADVLVSTSQLRRILRTVRPYFNRSTAKFDDAGLNESIRPDIGRDAELLLLSPEASRQPDEALPVMSPATSLLEAELEIGTVVVRLGHVGLSTIQIRAESFIARAIVRPLDLTATASLGGLFVEDLSQSLESATRFLVRSRSAQLAESSLPPADFESSNADGRLVILRAVVAQPGSPLSGDTQQVLSIWFQAIDLIAVRSTLVSMHQAVSELQSVFSEVDIDPPLAEEDSVGERGDDGPGTVAVAAARSTCSKVNVVIGSVRLWLESNGTNVAEICMSELKLSAIVSPTARRQGRGPGFNSAAQGSVGVITVCDLGAHSDQRLILSVDSDKTATVTFETFDSVAAAETGFDARLGLRLATLQLVYVKRFFEDLQRWISEIAVMRSLAEVGAHKARELAQWAATASSSARVSVNLDFSSPYIVVPSALQPEQRLVAQLGHMRVTNHFTDAGLEVISVTVAGMSLSAAASKVVDNIDITVGIERPLAGASEERRAAGLQVQCNVPVVCCRFDPSQLRFCLDVLVQNFKQDGVHPSVPDEASLAPRHDLVQSSVSPVGAAAVVATCQLRVNQLEVNVSGDDGSSILVVSGSSLSSAVTLYETKTQVIATLTSLLVADRRDGTPAPHKQLLVPRDDAGGNPLTLQFVSETGGPTTATVAFQRPRIQIEANLLASLLTALWPMVHAVTDVLPTAPDPAAGRSSSLLVSLALEDPVMRFSAADLQLNFLILRTKLSLELLPTTETLVSSNDTDISKLSGQFGALALQVQHHGKQSHLLRVEGFELGLTNRAHDTAGSMELSKFNLEDCTKPKEHPLRVLARSIVPGSAGARKKAMSIEFVQSSPASPNYASDSASVLTLRFLAFELNLEPSSCARAVAVLSALQTVSGQLASMWPPKAPEVDAAPPEVVPGRASVKAAVSVSSLQALLWEGDSRLTEAKVEALVFTATLHSAAEDHSGPTAVVAGSVGSARLVDLSPKGSRYPDVFAFNGATVADFRFDVLGTAGARVVDHGMVLRLRIASVRFLFLKRFVDAMLSWIDDFSAVFAHFGSPKTLRTRTASEPTLLSLDVELTNSYVVVPMHSDSADCLVADLGLVSVKNRFLRDPSGQVESQTVLLNAIMTSVTSGTGRRDGDRPASTIEQSPSKILDGVDLAMEIDVPYRSASTQRREAGMRVVCDVDSATVAANAKQVVLLLGVYTGNLAEALAISRRSGASSGSTPGAHSGVPAAKHSASPASLSSRAAVSQENDVPSSVVPNDGSGDDVISLELRVGTLTVELADSGGSPVVSASGRRLSLTTSASSELVTADASLSSFVVNDRRNTVSVFKEILGGGRGEESSVRLTYVSAGPKNDVLIEFDRPKIIVVADAVFALKNFLMPIYDDVMLSLDSRKKLLSIWQAPRPGRDVTTTKINFHEPDIRLTEDCSDAGSRSLAMRSTVELNITSSYSLAGGAVENRLNTEFLLRKLELRRVAMASAIDDSSASIVEPLDFAGVYLTVSPSGGGRTTLESYRLTTEGVRGLISYEDAKLLWHVYQSFMVASSAMPEANGGRPALSLAIPAQKLDVAIGTIRVVVLDDPGVGSPMADQPLLDVTVSNLNVACSDWSAKMNVAVRWQLQVSAFNRVRQHWEPVIERCELNVSGDSTGEGTSNYTVTSPGSSLNVNVSRPLLESVYDAFRIWQSVDVYGKPSKNTLPASSHAFVVCNRTGETVHYWSSTQAEVVNKLPPGAEEPLNLALFGVVSRGRQDAFIGGLDLTSAGTFCFRIKDDFRPVAGISLQSIGVARLMTRSDASGDVRLACRIQNHSGSRVISLESGVMITNKTRTPVEVKIQMPDKAPFGLPGPILPGSTVPLPVSFTGKGLVSFRPATRTHGWCDALSCLHLRDASDPALVTCKATAPGQDAPYIFRRVVASGPVISLVLEAPLIVYSTLPVAFDYRLFDAPSRRLLSKGQKLNQFEELHVHQSVFADNVALAIALPGFRPSSMTRITPTIEPSQIVCTDQFDRDLVISAEFRDGRITLYCDYFLVNHTGLPLSYADYGRRPLAGLGGEQSVSASTQLMYSAGQQREETENVVFVKAGPSEWSDALSLEAQGLSGYVELVEHGGRAGQSTRSFQLAVTVSASSDPRLWRTKVMSFSSRFVLVNRMDRPLLYRQADAASQVSIPLAAGETPLHWPDSKPDPKQLQLSLDGKVWSAGFCLDAVGMMSVTVPYGRGLRCFIRVKIVQDGATMRAVILPEDPAWPPYLIENNLSVPVLVVQRDVPGAVEQTVAPNSSMPYHWDDANLGNVLLVQRGGPQRGQWWPIKLDKVRGSRSNKDREFRAEIVARGPTRVLRILPCDAAVELLAEKHASATLALLVEFKSLAVSVIDARPKELMLITGDAFRLEYSDLNTNHNFDLRLGWLQVDNQTASSSSAVVLHPSPLPDGQPFLRLSVVRSREQSDVAVYPYWSVLAQEMHLSFDEEFLLRALKWLADMSEASFAKTDGSSDDSYLNNMIYFGMLQLNSFRVITSFKGDAGADKKLRQEMVQMLGISAKLLSRLDVSDASLELNTLVLLHAFGPRSELFGRMKSHYTSQLLRQAYKIVGSFDFLGNPVSFVRSIKTGVFDFFNEPAKGMVSSPEDFAAGVVKGTGSLLRHGTFAVSDSASRLTGSISKRLARYSFDPKYVQERKERNSSKPEDAVDGVGKGVRELGVGIFRGLTGVVTEPVRGLANEGARGLFKGLVRGVAGAAVKPVIGVMDLASHTTQGIRQEVAGKQDTVQRRRMPRFIARDGVLTPFDPAKASSQNILMQLHAGRFRSERLFHHWKLADQRAVILTSQALMVTTGVDVLQRVPLSALDWSRFTTTQEGVVVARMQEPSFTIRCDRRTRDEIASQLRSTADRQDADIQFVVESDAI